MRAGDESPAAMKKLIVFALIAAFAVFAWRSLPSPEGNSAFVNGLVVAIDRQAGLVTIDHGAVPALNMPPMTMGYPVKDRGWLERLEPMRRIEFQLSYDGKNYLITAIK